MNRNQRRMAAYNAMKAAEHLATFNYIKRIDSAFIRLSKGCSKRVVRAVSAIGDKSAPAYRQQPEIRANATERSHRRIAYRDVNPLGNKIRAVQKIKPGSKPLI